mgnify:CR=1 FL=1
MDESARLRKLLKRPLMTEKVVRLQETQHTYAFEVPRTTNKIEVKRAIEEIFDVAVQDVRTMTVHGKLKRLGRYLGRRPSWKKALVTLKPGETLELYENV